MYQLFKNFNKFKKNIALVNLKDEVFTYSDVLIASEKISKKIKKKSIILIIASNNIESIIGYVSFVRTKNLSIILDKTFKVEYAHEIIKKYKPNYIFTPKFFFKKNFLNEKIYSGKDYDLFKTKYKINKKLNSKNLISLTTSGTTQSPKLVRISNKNIIENTKNIAEYLKIGSKHTTITTMPMGYSYGLSIINTHLHKGSKIIVNEKTVFDRVFWETIKKYKVTSFGGVPSFYEILKKLKFENFDLPFLKYLTQAGGKLNLETLKYFNATSKKKNIKFIPMYGQTEASPRMSYLPYKNLSKNLGSIGKPLNKCFFKIFSEKNELINKPDAVGELVYYGKNVCLGYANTYNDFLKGDINKGKLRTGDIGYKNKKGYFYIVGRKKRFSKIFGIRYNLDDIEDYLKKRRFETKCLINDDNLIININKTYDINEMKRIIFENYRIRQNNIIIKKVNSFKVKSSFKANF